MGLYTYKICISLKFLFPFRCLLVTFCIIKYRRGGKQMPPCLAYMINITNPLMFNRTGKFEALSSKWTHSVQTTEDYELIVETKGNLYLQYPGCQIYCYPRTIPATSATISQAQ